MLVQVCLLLLGVGVFASYAQTEDPIFAELEVFPESFLTKYPQEGGFFTTKILVYLFFNIFSKHFAEKEPLKFWSKFNKDNYNRAAIDAAFYEYLTKFAADRKLKDQLYNPLESSVSSTEDIAVDRIGEYLDHLSETGVPPAVHFETKSQAYETESYEKDGSVCVIVPLRDPSFGIPGKDFPNYCDIPETSFTCEDKIVPGVYADIETGCQVFHICWPDRVDSFLCPIGSTFNEALLACDFWHQSVCGSPKPTDTSLFPKAKTPPRNTDGLSTQTPQLVIPEFDGTCQSLLTHPLILRMKFRPVKCEVSEWKPKPTKTFDVRQIGPMDIVAALLKDVLRFIARSSEQGRKDVSKVSTDQQGATKWQSRVQDTTEFPTEHGGVDTTSEQVHHSTTEMPVDYSPTSPNFRFVEKPVHEKAKTGESAHSKSSKLSEAYKRHALDMVIKSLELGGHVLSDDILPFIEKAILESPRKMSKSKEH